jgi:hypothetical protein
LFRDFPERPESASSAVRKAEIIIKMNATTACELAEDLPTSRQRAALRDDGADGAGERQVAAFGKAERKLDCIELR